MNVVVTRGFGSAGSNALIITRGFALGEAALGFGSINAPLLVDVTSNKLAIDITADKSGIDITPLQSAI